MSSNEQGRPFQSVGSRIALVFVALILVTGIVLTVVGVVSRANETAGATPAPTSTSDVSADPDDKSVCGLEGYEATGSLETAPLAEWDLVGTLLAPTSTTGAGPGRVDGDGFRSCYAHTSEGAVLAAANFLALGTDASLSDRMVELVAPGEGRDAAAAQSGSGGSTARADIVGYRVGAYTGDATTVDLALNYSTGKLISIPLKLVWNAGDWMLVLADDGSNPLAPGLLDNLGGYTPWGV